MSRFPTEVKLTEHLTVPGKLVKLDDPRSATRIVRISVADGDATDSSGDENDSYQTVKKKRIHEIRIQKQQHYTGGDSFPPRIPSSAQEAATVHNRGQPVKRVDPPSQVEVATIAGNESYSLRSPLSVLRFPRDNKMIEIQEGEGCIEWEDWGQIGRPTEEDSWAAVDEFWWDEDFVDNLENRDPFLKEDYSSMVELGGGESLLHLGEDIGSCNWDVDAYFAV
ncbi:hypothetical protein LINGRAHAP2_LOCUS14916 [Linum grandiflorum]